VSHINSGFWIGDFGWLIPEFAGLPTLESVALFPRIDISVTRAGFVEETCACDRSWNAEKPNQLGQHPGRSRLYVFGSPVMQSCHKKRAVAGQPVGIRRMGIAHNCHLGYSVTEK